MSNPPGTIVTNDAVDLDPPLISNSSTSLSNDMNQHTEHVQISSENPYTQLVYDLLTRNTTRIQSPNKQKLLDLITHILVIEVLYCFYLDYNVLLLGLRGLQLV